MKPIDLHEAQVRLAELVEAVIQGQEIIISQNNDPVVKLVSLTSKTATPCFGSAKGLIRMAMDFDEPLEDFAEYAP